MQIYNVLNFDGIDDYLQTPQATIPANSDFTMEASFTSTATSVGCSGYFKRLLSLELSNYYDGVLVLTEAGLLNINNVQRGLYVGRWGLQGNVDEVRVWNYTVSQMEIVNRRLCQLTGNEAGLLLYYPFNQGVYFVAPSMGHGRRMPSKFVKF